jgi:hypothetical protein
MRAGLDFAIRMPSSLIAYQGRLVPPISMQLSPRPLDLTVDDLLPRRLKPGLNTAALRPALARLRHKSSR